MADAASAFFDAVTRLVFVRDEPAPADVIFVPGSTYRGHVALAAALWREGWAPLVLPSGRCPLGGSFSKDGHDTEWAWMRSVLLAEGVPESAILREARATYTWENAKFSRAVCDAAGLTVRRGLICCKGYHARRALIYYQTAFPEAELRVCPAERPGRTAEDWHRTPEGRARILAEVRRLGDQINGQLEELLRDERRNPDA